MHTTNNRQTALHAIRERIKGESGSAQCQRLLVALQALGSVSTFEASRHLDIYHPPARAKELRRDGHSIITLRRQVETEAGVRHNVGVYVLSRGQRAAAVAP